MALDEPLDAIQDRIAAEERASSPLSRFIRPVAEVLGLIPGANIAVTALARAAALFIERESQDRFKDLLAVLIDEVKRVNARLPSIEAMEQDRRQFQREFPSLVLDGLRKAEQTRAKERVRRLGKILGHAYQEGPLKPSYLAEELMRVAMSLDEQDVRVLSWLCEGVRSHYSAQAGQVDHEYVNSFWGQVDDQGLTRSMGYPALPEGVSIGEVLTCCAKLQAFGLGIQVRRNDGKVAPSIMPYAPLKRGYEFLAYIQGAAEP